jgi:hypothetical protein
MGNNQTADSGESGLKRIGEDERGRLGFFELLGKMKPPQFLAAVMILSTFLGGAFGYGYKFGIQNARSKATKAETAIAPAKNEAQQFRALQAKEQFLDIYLRYLIAKETYAKHETEENRALLDSARSTVASFIGKLVSNEEKGLEENGSVRLFYTETNGRTPMIKFSFDGSVWPLDSDIGFAWKKR